MSFGMVIRNSDGALAVDSEFLNYALREEFSTNISVTTTFAQTTLNYSSPIATDGPPLVAVKWPANNNLFCWGIRQIGTPGSWTGFGIYLQAIPGAGTVNFEFSIFEANPVGSGGFGIVSRGADGNVTFDSQFTPLEITAFVDPSGWATLSTSLPVPGYRVTFYSKPNPALGSGMVLSCHRYGDLVYPGGVEGATPAAIAGYGYGYGTGGTIRLCLTLDTGTPNVNPSALSTPAVYISPMTLVGF